MPSLATRRLIDAAATLDPADRALLNLWVNRGLDDERLTELTGMSVAALGTRRENIVARLAAELGLPEPDIRGALEQISPDEEFVTAPDVERITTQPSAPNGSAPPAAPERAGEESLETRLSSEAPQAVDEPSPGARRRRGLWLGLAALGIAVAAVIVVITTGGSSPQKSHRAASTQRPPAAATHTPTVAAPNHPTGGPPPAPLPLAGLPGGLAHASGRVKLSGPVKHLRLNLTVRGLPAARNGHHEVWLYNSVLDSRPLARLRTGHHRLVARLPADARRYRWIDVSFQPVSVINHSGESELRASNPAHTTKARLRKRSSRTRHRLRQASTVSAAHPATTHRTRAGSSTEGHGGRAQRKRAANGSKNSSTSK